MTTRKRRGLTLIELVVVIAILSMLMAAVGVYAMGVFSESKRTVAAQDVQTALNSLELFKSMRGRYPSAAGGFREVVDAHAMKKLPKDPWGSPLTYALENGEPVVTSLGADGTVGGTGDNADLSSRELEVADN